MDLTKFTQVSVAGVPLIFVVIGFVYWFKSFTKSDGSPRFSGNILLLISMGWGLLLGGGYMVSQNRPPAGGPPGDAWEFFVYWFAVFVYGMAMGMVASGLYSAVKDIIGKQLGAAIEKMLHPEIK